MRNKYPGICYYCGKEVKPHDGHFELHVYHGKTTWKDNMESNPCELRFCAKVRKDGTRKGACPKRGKKCIHLGGGNGAS